MSYETHLKVILNEEICTFNKKSHMIIVLYSLIFGWIIKLLTCDTELYLSSLILFVCYDSKQHSLLSFKFYLDLNIFMSIIIIHIFLFI